MVIQLTTDRVHIDVDGSIGRQAIELKAVRTDCRIRGNLQRRDMQRPTRFGLR